MRRASPGGSRDLGLEREPRALAHSIGFRLLSLSLLLESSDRLFELPHPSVTLRLRFAHPGARVLFRCADAIVAFALRLRELLLFHALEIREHSRMRGFDLLHFGANLDVLLALPAPLGECEVPLASRSDLVDLALECFQLRLECLPLARRLLLVLFLERRL